MSIDDDCEIPRLGECKSPPERHKKTRSTLITNKEIETNTILTILGGTQ